MFRNMWEKEKLLITSNFSFSISVKTVFFFFFFLGGGGGKGLRNMIGKVFFVPVFLLKIVKFA